MNIAYLSLGSNIGDRLANLQGCIARLATFGKVTKVSSFYETEPMEVLDQPWFLNCAVQLATELAAQELLAAVRHIEEEMGRRRDVSKGPRTIDVDILLFGSRVIEEADLHIPHPAMRERRFVLEPLAEIAPEARDPISGLEVRQLLVQLGMRGGEVKPLAIAR